VSWSSHSDLIDWKWASGARVKYEVPLCGGIAPRMADYRSCTGGLLRCDDSLIDWRVGLKGREGKGRKKVVLYILRGKFLTF
jgi:hypothetical protein